MDRDLTLGLILDGGLGRRMGRMDKGLLPLAGKPMIAHVVERLHPQCAALAISANGDAGRFAKFGLTVLSDDPPDFAGPLAGVLAGLEYCAQNPPLSYVATLPADTPFAPSDFVARLHEARRQAGGEIAVARSAGRTHYVAALWAVGLAAALRHALRHEGLRRAETFVSRFRHAFAEWPDAPGDPFFNVNARPDLERAEAMLRELSNRRVR